MGEADDDTNQYHRVHRSAPLVDLRSWRGLSLYLRQEETTASPGEHARRYPATVDLTAADSYVIFGAVDRPAATDIRLLAARLIAAADLIDTDPTLPAELRTRA